MSTNDNYDAFNPPLAATQEFMNYVQTWDVIIVWDKDHTMVDQANQLRPHLKEAILGLQKEFPHWRHVVLTENNMDSVRDMFNLCPTIRPIFDMVLCEDNYFSKKSIHKLYKQRGAWWVWDRQLRKERARRKKRRVNDLFLGKKVVLIDDLRDGRIPEHSFCILSRVWTGEPTNQDEIEWPKTIKGSILRLLRNLYHHSEPGHELQTPPTVSPGGSAAASKP